MSSRHHSLRPARFRSHQYPSVYEVAQRSCSTLISNYILEVLGGPFHQTDDMGHEALAQFSNGVFNPWRNLWTFTRSEAEKEPFSRTYGTLCVICYIIA